MKKTFFRSIPVCLLAVLLLGQPAQGALLLEGFGSVQPRGESAYDINYPLRDYLEEAGLQYADAVYATGEGEGRLERRPRQDGYYGLYNYFGLSDELCSALYGEGVQSGTGERAADGDSLLILARVPLYQENTGSDAYKQERNELAVAIRTYLNSFSWQTESQLYRAQYAALYIASNCAYDTSLYERFLQSGQEDWTDPSFTAYGCLVSKKAVCEGFCVAYQLLTRATGLDSFCAPDDHDPEHMFVYVRADGDWYKVDLAVLNIAPQDLVDRCFKTTVNEEVSRTQQAFAAYGYGAGETGRGVDFLAPGNLTNVTMSRRVRVY